MGGFRVVCALKRSKSGQNVPVFLGYLQNSQAVRYLFYGRQIAFIEQRTQTVAQAAVEGTEQIRVSSGFVSLLRTRLML
jgi:hypothetical protein